MSGYGYNEADAREPIWVTARVGTLAEFNEAVALDALRAGDAPPGGQP